MSLVKILNQFKKSWIDFLDELIEQFPDEGDLVVYRIFLKDQIHIKDVMTYFVHKILPLEKEVKERNENFFLNHCQVFDKHNKVIHFKKLWRSPQLDQNDKDVIWSWIDHFIMMAKQYQNTVLKNVQKSEI